MKKLSAIILSLGMVLGANAQSELTLPFMRDIFQSSYVNPTIIPEHTVSIGIPGISLYGQVITNGFVPNNFLAFRQDSMRINLTDFYNDLKDKNMIFVGENMDLFHLRMKVQDGYYWFGIRQNTNVSFFYPKELFSIPIKGNAPFVGEEMNFGNTKLDVSLYNEYTFGIAKEFPRWTFGGRISLLQGLSNIHFDPKAFNIAIDTGTYKLTAKSNATVYTSRIPKNAAGEINMDHVNLDNIQWITDYLTNFKNKGYSLSLGATFKLDDKTRFSASLYNLGFINWKDSVENYSMTGSAAFDGMKIISDYLYNRETNVDSVLNDMVDKFNQDTVYTTYRTWLNPKFYLSATYDITNRTTVGLSFSGVYNKKMYPAFTIGLQQGVGRFFNLIATLSANQRTFKNLGVGLMIKPGPFQIFVIADNVYPAINPLYTTNINVRFGINLVFGRVKQAEGLPFR